MQTLRDSRRRFPHSRVARPLPRHPARPAISGMAGLLARESTQLAAFPTCRICDGISGIGQALFAYSCGGSRGFASPPDSALEAYHIPSSLSRSREAIKHSSTPVRRHIVNGGRSTNNRFIRTPQEPVLSIPHEPRWLGEGADAMRAAPAVAGASMLSVLSEFLTRH